MSAINYKFSSGTSGLARVIGLLTALLLPYITFGQNCALCYTQAAGSGSRLIQALRGGILMLALPPMFICAAITIMAYKKRNKFNE